MFSSFGKSWRLVKASYGVLKQDKQLLIFPIMSTIGLILVTIAMMFPVALSGILDAVANTDEVTTGQSLLGFIFAFAFYFVTYTVIIFSNTALIGAAMIRLDGGNPTFKDGINVARERLSTIFGWAAISATVGMILNAIQSMIDDSDNPVGQIMGSILVNLVGFAWNLMTFLVIPVFVVENIGPVEAIKRSGSLVKRTWGENVTGTFSMGIIQFLITLAVIFLIGMPLFFLAGSMESTAMLIFAMILLVVIIGAIGIFFSALNGIFQAALYKYAVNDGDTDAVSDFFDPSLIQGAFEAKPVRR
jgi:hypothetical protein